MRYGICNETFGDWPFKRACEFAAECGYTGIEIAPFTLGSDPQELSEAQRGDLRRTIAQAGLACIGLHWLLITYLLQTWGELALSPIGLSAFSRYSPKRYVGQMFGLWFLASAIGGVLAGLLGGEATDGGLSSMSPIFSYMVQYYLGIAGVLVVLAYFFREPAKNPT